MKVAVIAVGAPKSSELSSAIREYESRIAHYFTFEAVEIRPRRIPPSGKTTSIARAESESLLARVPKGLEVVAVDRRGTPWSSEQLADYLEGLAVLGKPGVAFLIGGPVGLSEALRQQASRILSLSPLTLPHELARLVLTEQIYRAGTIQRGEPYHKAG